MPHLPSRPAFIPLISSISPPAPRLRPLHRPASCVCCTKAPMSDEIKMATEVNMACKEAVDECCYHTHYARTQFPEFVARLRATMRRRLLPFPGSPQRAQRANVPMPKLLEEQRNELQLLEFSDDQYKKLMRTFDEVTNGWQTLFDSPRAPSQARLQDAGAEMQATRLVEAVQPADSK